MVKITQIKFPKRKLAFALSAAVLISFMPISSNAAEKTNMEVPSIINNTINIAAATGSATIPDNSQPGTSTGGSINTGSTGSNTPGTVTDSTAAPDTNPSDTITGGTLTPDNNTPEESTPPSTGGSQIVAPVITPSPDNSQPDSTTPPATDNNQTGTSTGGAVTPDTNPSDTATGGAAEPDNSQPEDTTTSLPAIGTKITVGNYIYRVTSSNTVALKGFAKGVSLSTVIAVNQITYKKVVYKVTKIGSSAFKGQTGIKKVIIRKNITDIASNSFYNCKNITKVTIRTGVTIIRKQAFMGCAKLKTINITSPVLAQVKKNAFKNIKTGAVINVVNKKARLAVKAAIPSNVTVNQM
ncbi:MAG: leucine-rich repeat protein [Lachnospiraceae bacterium]|nr:leucine-rich repeat protein [Lachnospiraceae bacterium]